MPNSNITKEELNTLATAENGDAWNKACDAIKKVRGGVYPSDWFTKVMISGFSAAVSDGWERKK